MAEDQNPSQPSKSPDPSSQEKGQEKALSPDSILNSSFPLWKLLYFLLVDITLNSTYIF